MYQHGLYSAWALWPLWTVHTIVLILELTVLCYLVLDWDGQYHELPAGYTTSLSLAFVNFVVEPLEMVLWTYHLLEPWVYLVLQILKAILWSVIAAFGFWILLAPKVIVSTSWLDGLLYTLLAATLVAFYASLVYAIIIFYRSNKTVGYELPPEKEQMAFNNSIAMMQRHALARPVSSVYED